MAVKKVTLKDGSTRWRLRLYAGTDPDTGRQSIVTRTFDLKRDADAELTRLKGQKDGGASVAPSRERFGKYLRRWLAAKKAEVRPVTWAEYSGAVRRYIENPPESFPLVAGVRLDLLKHEHLQALYNAMSEAGLSPRAVRGLHATLRQALGDAVRTRARSSNPASRDLVKLPALAPPEPKAMTPEEVERFLEAARADRHAALWPVLVLGGLRPSEALALQWPDVDLEGGNIRITKALTRRGVEGWKLLPTKTKQARRTVTLPAVAVQALRESKARQAREQLQLGSEYERHGFVFATELGRPLDSTNLTRNFKLIMERAGLGEWDEPKPRAEGKPGPKPKPNFRPAYHLYSLRHTCATLLFRRGHPAKVVAERLGHKKSSFTADVYQAYVPDMQEAVAEDLDAMLAGR